METKNKVTIPWPRCPEHDVPLALRPEVEVGSPWACPECGAIDISEDMQP